MSAFHLLEAALIYGRFVLDVDFRAQICDVFDLKRERDENPLANRSRRMNFGWNVKRWPQRLLLTRPVERIRELGTHFALHQSTCHLCRLASVLVPHKVGVGDVAVVCTYRCEKWLMELAWNFFLGPKRYSTGYDKWMYTWRWAILYNIRACCVPELTLLVVFGTEPCETKAIWALHNRFIVVINLQNLTRNTNRRNYHKRQSFTKLKHFLSSTSSCCLAWRY